MYLKNCRYISLLNEGYRIEAVAIVGHLKTVLDII